jgi:energy-coupling factor transporter ATP-binding protein EcfA2
MTFNKFHPAKKYKWVVTPLKMLKEMMEGRRENEKDNVILVTGARGDGKSTLTGKILFLFEIFDPYESIVYTKEAFFKQLKKKNNYVWADEGVVNAAKGNVMTRANKLLFEGLTINRDNFNIVFFLLPFVEDFDSKILQYCSAWIHIDSRGLGVLMLPSNKGLFGKRNWDIDAMKKLFDEFQKENQKATHMPYWVYPNFRGYIKFGKLTIQQDKIIKEIKFLRKNENLDKQTQEEVVVEVKELTNYKKYSSIKLAEKIMKGEIRDMEVFKMQCTDLKLEFDETLSKCDSILRRIIQRV